MKLEDVEINDEAFLVRAIDRDDHIIAVPLETGLLSVAAIAMMLIFLVALWLLQPVIVMEVP